MKKVCFALALALGLVGCVGPAPVSDGAADGAQDSSSAEAATPTDAATADASAG